MKQVVGWIVLLVAAWYAWTHFGAALVEEREPASPQIAWYLENVDHHFSIVHERDDTYYFRGYHENGTERAVLGVYVTIRIRQDGEWQFLKSVTLPPLQREERKTIDLTLDVPRRDDVKLQWEITRVRLRDF